MDMKMRKLLRGGGDFVEGDSHPQPLFSGRKAGGGGIKIVSCQVPPDAPKYRDRYAFRIEGTAPSGLVLSDVATMLEARFQGDPKFNLRHTQDEAIKRLKERLEKREEKLRSAEDRAQARAKELEEKKAEYDKTKAEIEGDALKDLEDRREKITQDMLDREREAARIRTEIDQLQEQLAATQNQAATRLEQIEADQDRLLRSMETDKLNEPLVPLDRLESMASDLLDHWRSTLQEYDEMPLPSEFDDLSGMFAKLLEKTISRVNDRWRDSGRQEPKIEKPSPKIESKDRSKGGLF